jgi:hypothetical protein
MPHSVGELGSVLFIDQRIERHLPDFPEKVWKEGKHRPEQGLLSMSGQAKHALAGVSTRRYPGGRP